MEQQGDVSLPADFGIGWNELSLGSQQNIVDTMSSPLATAT